MKNFCPAVSVIIPLYNAEKYISECLDSILAQTFTNFEVIVVDDCSTDSSVAIVQSYAEKFGGRLTLSSLEKNSGGGGLPRNKGLTFSRGEYVFFMDADDVFTRTGLEELYTLAKDYDADCVYCEKYYTADADGTNIKLTDWPIEHSVDKPTLETNDLAKRIVKAINFNYWVTPWLRLVSRNLLIENDTKFPSLIGSNDVAWTFEVLFCSKRFLIVPNCCYVRRIHEESVSFRKRTVAQHVHKWMDRTIRSLKDLDNFMKGRAFFKENPEYRYAVINSFVEKDFGKIFQACSTESPFDIYSIFRKEFGEYLGEQDVLIPALCAALNTQQKINALNIQQFNEYAAQAQAHIAQLEAKLNRKN